MTTTCHTSFSDAWEHQWDSGGTYYTNETTACLGCHGSKNYKNVYPTYNVPKICGQNAQYILDALAGYANGDRPHETMHAQAATLSEKDLQDIAAFFSDAGACAGGERRRASPTGTRPLGPRARSGGGRARRSDGT